jgi:hypothetical protein
VRAALPGRCAPPPPPAPFGPVRFWPDRRGPRDHEGERIHACPWGIWRTMGGAIGGNAATRPRARCPQGLDLVCAAIHSRTPAASPKIPVARKPSTRPGGRIRKRACLSGALEAPPQVSFSTDLQILEKDLNRYPAPLCYACTGGGFRALRIRVRMDSYLRGVYYDCGVYRCVLLWAKTPCG